MCACVFGQPALSDVAMEEVCCRLVRCRRRTSSLTLPRSKLVRLEKQRVGFLLQLSLVAGVPHSFHLSLFILHL